MHHVLRATFLGASLVTATAGCMSWYSTPELAVPPFAAPAANRERVRIDVDTRYHAILDGDTGLSSPFDATEPQVWADRINGWAAEVFEGSDRYELMRDEGTPEFQLRLRTLRTVASFGHLFLSFYSLFLIPTVEDNIYDTEALLIRRDGKVIGRKMFSHRMITLMHAISIPASPFTTSGSMERRMWRKILNAILVWTDAEIADY